ncbi:hypothetical protein V3H18_11130 [Methylocystis sp. 9N]|uniref:Uncharacterized protein n=1 Tax=Methylocystis borbori TaxID=3118750 RepID=A0ABU7XIQ1_9HYPH
MPPYFYAPAPGLGRSRGAKASGLTALALLLAACAPRTPPLVGPNPVEPAAPTRALKARSLLQPYASRRPVEPTTPWKQEGPTRTDEAR